MYLVKSDNSGSQNQYEILAMDKAPNSNGETFTVKITTLTKLSQNEKVLVWWDPGCAGGTVTVITEFDKTWFNGNRVY